jgi:hypothetical protein
MNMLQHIDACRSDPFWQAHYLSLLLLTPLKPVSSKLAVQQPMANTLQTFVPYETLTLPKPVSSKLAVRV